MGVRKSLGETVAGGISIFLGPFQYTRNGQELHSEGGRGGLVVGQVACLLMLFFSCMYNT